MNMQCTRRSASTDDDVLWLDPGSCPCCDGTLVLLGQLGNLWWFRCRQCGADCSRHEAKQ
jgi:hypothetical protein